MKNYLELVPISAKVHKKQSRMTRTCIILAVFLISAIFGMADMEIQNQKQQTIKTDGAWHVGFRDLTEEQKNFIGSRPEIAAASNYAVTNYDLEAGYKIAGKETVICGFDESFAEMFPMMKIAEGSFPKTRDEVVMTRNIKEQLGTQLGDVVELEVPGQGKKQYTISGFAEDASVLAKRDAYGLFMNKDSYTAEFPNDAKCADWMYYVQFKPHCNVQNTLKEIQLQFSLEDEQIAENVKMLGLMMQSSDSYMKQLYGAAALLALLVMVSGILMITGSLNSNVASRVEFFGMLRCLGATKRQIIRFVQREALSWCKTAIPIGVGLSTFVQWGLCAMLRAVSPRFFADMPILRISWIGIGAGAFIGIITVLVAATRPAKKASKVSPLTAVSGNARTEHLVKKAAKTKFCSVETSLGIHHAMGSRRNFLLMVSSFGFSIIMFLSFITAMDFMHHALQPLKPYTPDLSIVSADNSCSIPVELVEQLQKKPFVNRAYGRSFAYEIPIQFAEADGRVNLISYEEKQFEWADSTLLSGSLEDAIAGNGVLVVYRMNEIQHQPGDSITFETDAGVVTEKISGILSDSPFQEMENTETVICSEALFHKLAGEQNYTIIDIQLNRSATDDDVASLRQETDQNLLFSDQRVSNQEVKGAYYSFAFFVYGFLAIIALIAVFHIVNSISMSVSSRIQQYGAMRAIGMSDRQFVKMVAAEAVTYGGCGILGGLLVGLPLNKLLYEMMITAQWGTPWYVPVMGMILIVLVIVAAVILAIAGPAQRIRELSIVDTIQAR